MTRKNLTGRNVFFRKFTACIRTTRHSNEFQERAVPGMSCGQCILTVIEDLLEVFQGLHGRQELVAGAALHRVKLHCTVQSTVWTTGRTTFRVPNEVLQLFLMLHLVVRICAKLLLCTLLVFVTLL